LGFLIFVILAFGYVHYQVGIDQYQLDNYHLDSLKIRPFEKIKLDRAYNNNASLIIKECKLYNYNSAYFLALSVLESSGKKTPNKRFEKKVYQHLIGVRDGRYKTFGSIKRKKLKGISDGGIKNLATSWGPFQLMGYQAFELGVFVNDIRGKEAIHHGIKWCNQRYGKYLKKKDYANAFHIHNTGKPIPLSGKPYTHDPNYIDNGLRYMAYFDAQLKKENRD
jgi:hypothetical protein